MVWLFVVHFGYSWGPCGWVIISEVWPLSNRAYGIALGASSNWMSNFIVGQITPDMLETLKYGTFIFFGLLTFGGAVFVWFVVPETKRLTLEEMDILFGSVGLAQAVSQWTSFNDIAQADAGPQDSQRMAEIQLEIGLDDVLKNLDLGSLDSEKKGGKHGKYEKHGVEGVESE